MLQTHGTNPHLSRARGLGEADWRALSCRWSPTWFCGCPGSACSRKPSRSSAASAHPLQTRTCLFCRLEGDSGRSAPASDWWTFPCQEPCTGQSARQQDRMHPARRSLTRPCRGVSLVLLGRLRRGCRIDDGEGNGHDEFGQLATACRTSPLACLCGRRRVHGLI